MCPDKRRASGDGGYPVEETKVLTAVIDVSGGCSSDVDAFCSAVQSMSRKAGLAIRGPIPKPTQRLEGGQRVYLRTIYVEADPGLLGAIARGRDVPEGVKVTLSFEETVFQH